MVCKYAITAVDSAVTYMGHGSWGECTWASDQSLCTEVWILEVERLRFQRPGIQVQIKKKDDADRDKMEIEKEVKEITNQIKKFKADLVIVTMCPNSINQNWEEIADYIREQISDKKQEVAYLKSLL